jgi:hypothetical protein
MKTKRFFLVLFIISFVILPIILLHQSQHPAFWRWSSNYIFIVVIYTGFVVACFFAYLLASKWGAAFSFYFIGMYVIGVIFTDFLLGTMWFHTRVPSRSHPVYHHSKIPGSYRLAVSDRGHRDHAFTVNITKLRLRRSGEIPLSKGNDVFRIMVLGDSFAFGDGVDDDETFCSLVEQGLNASQDGTMRYEVLNSGVGSFTPILEYLYLKTDGIRFDPDFVILFFDMSDLYQTQVLWKRAEVSGTGEAIRITMPQRSGFYRFVMVRFFYLSQFFQYVEGAILGKSVRDEALLRGISEELMGFTKSQDQSPWEEQWQRIFADIAYSKKFCEARNIDFLVVIYPWGHQVSGYEWAEGRKQVFIPPGYTAPPDVFTMLEDRLTEMGITVLNLFPAFRDYQGRELLYFSRDMHWSEHGHRLVGKELTAYLKERFSREENP